MILNFEKGYALVYNFEGETELYGMIDISGEELIAPEYDYLDYQFREKLLLARKGEKFGFIDIQNKIIIPFEYDSAESFSNGLAAVAKDGKYGFIDVNNNIIVPLEYPYVDSYSNGFAIIYPIYVEVWGDRLSRELKPTQIIVCFLIKL